MTVKSSIKQTFITHIHCPVVTTLQLCYKDGWIWHCRYHMVHSLLPGYCAMLLCIVIAKLQIYCKTWSLRFCRHAAMHGSCDSFFYYFFLTNSIAFKIVLFKVDILSTFSCTDGKCFTSKHNCILVWISYWVRLKHTQNSKYIVVQSKSDFQIGLPC